jgi:hypothetical protein
MRWWFAMRLRRPINGTFANLHLDGKLWGGDKLALAVGSNSGLIEHVAVKCVITGNGGTEEAGLAAENTGVIRDSSAQVNIRVGGAFYTGGLVAINSGTISTSWTDGVVRGGNNPTQLVGGFVALNAGTIQNNYALANTTLPDGHIWNIAHGGLIAQTSTAANYPSTVVATYGAGATARRRVPPFESNDGLGGYGGFGFAGAVVGFDGSNSTFQSTYWATRQQPAQSKSGRGQQGSVVGRCRPDERAAEICAATRLRSEDLGAITHHQSGLSVSAL